MEGDTPGFSAIANGNLFQSTPSAWRETDPVGVYCTGKSISIHSLRMEGDCISQRGQGRHRHFNPLPPHGGRLAHSAVVGLGIQISIHSLRMEGDEVFFRTGRGTAPFQSTPSAWRETTPPVCSPCATGISIHSLRMEGDCTTGVSP